MADAAAQPGAELSDEHHDWVSSFCGIDTKGLLGAASSVAGAVEGVVAKGIGAAADAVGKAASTAESAVAKGVGAVEGAVGTVADAVKSAVADGAAVQAMSAPAEAKAAPQATPAAPPPAPDTPADPAKQALYLKEAGDGTEVSENDIHQGQVGDCFALSSMGEIAKLKPDVVKKMIKDNGDGTYTVTLHKKDNGAGNLWGLFSDDYKEVQVKVTADTPAASVNHNAGQSEEGGKKEIWPLLLEKAYAQVNGGYAGITKGGDPKDALETLTGHSADTKNASSVSLDDLKKAAAKGKPMVFSTPGDTKGKEAKLPFGMHGNHAYMFEGLETDKDGKTYVRLKNPWGYDDPQLIPYDQLTKSVSTVSTGSLE